MITADFLKLVGFEVVINDKLTKSFFKQYRGKVKGLSDDCYYLILSKSYKNRFINWLLSFRKKEMKILIGEINIIKVVDRNKVGELNLE
ncbi:hypothetical protein LCGC14_2322200 [marine sediment metagenome]|uniref:Uncharacterized protein n=1 Tax=marine sediment metagenome TaxID=412755 RepID=A0A0F9D528_9ZZZZ